MVKWQQCQTKVKIEKESWGKALRETYRTVWCCVLEQGHKEEDHVIAEPTPEDYEC